MNTTLQLRNRIPSIDDPFILSMIKKNLGQYPTANRLNDQKILDRLNHHSRVWILSTLNQNVGFISWSEKGQILFLELCVIDEDYQGKGIASKYIHRLEAYAKKKGFTSIQFYVDKKNERAFRLYKRFGYKPVFTLPFMKSYLMNKQLK